MTAYAFRPMSVADLPTIRRWLETPHVSQWWHDPSEQFELVSGDLDHPDMTQFIVTADTREFAYLQCYDISAWNVGFGPQPDGTRGLDQLIASGAPRVVIDPDPANERAIRSYEKAGFSRDRIVNTPDGPALLVVRNS
jgi:aminoglycoside 6'-N-acetyltransferase